MKLSIATWNLKAESMAAKCAYARALGFKVVSLLHTAPPVDAEGENLPVLVAEHDLCVLVHGAIGDTSHPEELERVAQQIEAVGRFQQETGRVRAMNFDPGYRIAPGNVRLYDPDVSAGVLELALERLRPLDVQVGIENWAINHDLDYYHDLGRRLGTADLGVLLDLGHLHIAHHSGQLGEMTPYDYITSLPLPVWEIHVHDNDGRRDRHSFLGRGNLDLEPMAKALRHTGFDGFVTLEIILLDVQSKSTRRNLCASRDRILSTLRNA